MLLELLVSAAIVVGIEVVILGLLVYGLAEPSVKEARAMADTRLILDPAAGGLAAE